MKQKRVGFYCWAGPGTIRMIKLKYFNPPIDTDSLMTSYSYENVKKIKDIFGITDWWATYSWGFSDKTEKEDYSFLINQLDNFKRNKIRLHAYIQGPNVVYEEFPEKDWYCKDEKGRRVTYFKGRHVVCLNNPYFQEYIAKKIIITYKYNFDGIFIDNIQMGQLALIEGNKPFNFFGCYCEYCKSSFKSEFQCDIPTDPEKNEDVTNKYINWRISVVTNFISYASDIVKKGKMQFGTNSYDPKFNTQVIFGTKISELAKKQDYLFFENHTLASNGINNIYLNDISNNLKKQIFVVSYKKGIGRDQEYSQEDMENIINEANMNNFSACIKGSEYVDSETWHNLTPNHFNHILISQTISNSYPLISNINNRSVPSGKITKLILRKAFNPVFTQYMENKFVRNLLDPLYYNFIK